MRLIVSGGGTGGHIYPALALIEEVKKREPNSEILYVGAKRGLETKIIPEQGIQFKSLEIQGFKRSLSLENFKTIYLFLKSVHEAKKILKNFRPDVVLGTGGYVCGAVVYAASRLNIPTMIHEQNSVAGVTNKFLAYFVDKIGISFESSFDQFPKKKTILIGNPRAQQVASIKKSNQLVTKYGLKDNKKTVLIFGGSQGAKKINNVTVQAIEKFSGKDYQILFITGQKHFDEVKKKIKNLPKNVFVKPYINDMPLILPEISCIVGRAGATSLSEITALGIPSILIPSPYVTNDHQTKNAMDLVNKKAAVMIKEKELDKKSIVAAIDKIMMDETIRKKMSENAKKIGKTDSASLLYESLKEISR